jgi:hypothetical protein
MIRMSQRTWRGLREAALVPLSLAGVTAILLALGNWLLAAG